MLQDALADALSQIKNADKIGKREVVTRANKEIRAVLTVMQEHSYIGDGKSGKFRVELNGRVIDANVIKPRFSVKVDEFEKWEKRFLPAREFGILIVSTPKGIVDHKKAMEMKIGGKLLAFVY